MSQFVNTEHANEAFRSAIEKYKSDREKIKIIRTKIKEGLNISNEDIIWLCSSAEHGISQQESNWYSHD
jgi:hypothetical protein